MSRHQVNNFYINHSLKAVVYRRRRDLILFILRFPFAVVLCVLALPFLTLWAVWEGVKGFFRGFLEFFYEGVLIVFPLSVKTIYALIFYKKVNRSEASNE